MPTSFASELNLFASSVDLVDEAICKDVRQQVSGYLLDSLKMDYWEVQIDGVSVAGKGGEPPQPGLETFKCVDNWTNGKPTKTPIHDEDGGFVGQTTFAYEKGWSLWITSQDGQPLDASQTFKDSWKGVENLPRYWKWFKDVPIHTSIIVPLAAEERVFGFLNVESKECIPFSDIASSEFRLLGEAIGSIIWSYLAHKNHHRTTEAAFNEVKQRLVNLADKADVIHLPSLFVASAGNASPDVMAVVHSVIDEFADRVVKVFWKEINSSGDINSQVADAIGNSRYGLCYYSEPDTQGDYKDNPNVLIEAGMMHALVNAAPNKEPRAWIPVRERSSEKTPFDLAAQRTLIVPRLQDGTLNKEDLENNLRKRLHDLLGGSE